ncbi:hypothetical protein FRC10_002889 [Ceratobasidium sp. 414]|nr:hypothetical protein FRC10_002889 [Ceratobasidium sp. 414]
MCPPEITVKAEEVDDAPSPGLFSGSDQGAKAENTVPEPLTPSKVIDSRYELVHKLNSFDNDPFIYPRPGRTKTEDDDDDDVLTSLCALFGEHVHAICYYVLPPDFRLRLDGMWPDSADDDSESESDDSEPGLHFTVLTDSLAYFLHGDNRYFFDQDHNVFLEGEYGRTALIHRGLPFPNPDDNVLDVEWIEGLPYYFGVDGNLWCLDQDINPVQVPTWTASGFDQLLNSFVVPEFSQDNVAYGSNFDFQDPSQTVVSNGAYCDSTKVEAYSFNPNPLQGSLQGQRKMPWSPSSSTMSPIVSAGSRASSEPLEPLITTGNPDWVIGSVQAWKEETKIIQQERNTTPDKLDRRRCRHCHKVFRRPSSLEDHLNVHSGAKRFATKSNMKRHFLTHRVGTLEEYARNGKPGKADSNSLTATYNAKACYTQRFRLLKQFQQEYSWSSTKVARGEQKDLTVTIALPCG